MRIAPQICGKWDGCAVWLQWSPADPAGETEYQLELRYRRKEEDAWNEWMRVIPRQGVKSHWAVVPTWKEGWQCEARVRPLPSEGDSGWEYAVEVTFTKCTCEFEISSAKYPQHFDKGTIFSSQVDAAAASYELLEEIEVAAGGSVRTRMKSTGSSGYHQLDYPKHFEIKPSLGCEIYNTAPSTDDVTPTGRMFTEIAPNPIDGPLVIAVAKRERF